MPLHRWSSFLQARPSSSLCTLVTLHLPNLGPFYQLSKPSESLGCFFLHLRRACILLLNIYLL
ncbi:hypothetical protein K438DRAFT_1857953, partial [Mycena galopus ATCC 62051]